VCVLSCVSTRVAAEGGRRKAGLGAEPKQSKAKAKQTNSRLPRRNLELARETASWVTAQRPAHHTCRQHAERRTGAPVEGERRRLQGSGGETKAAEFRSPRTSRRHAAPSGRMGNGMLMLFGCDILLTPSARNPLSASRHCTLPH
jgi:hypothetical protein